MKGWAFVPNAAENFSIDLIRAVRFLLYGLETKLGDKAKPHTKVEWLAEGHEHLAKLNCNLLKSEKIVISSFDPVCFDSWLDAQANEWIGE